jgi:hypothetical protein
MLQIIRKIRCRDCPTLRRGFATGVGQVQSNYKMDDVRCRI